MRAIDTMRILRGGFDLERFFATVSTARTAALLLDYDGTLAPFHIDPARADPYPGVLAALEDLTKAERTRLVIVSGRWTRDLLPLLRLDQVPETWGVHGWERLMPDGHYEIEEPPEQALSALVAADDWAADLVKLGARPERKPASIAFHWRGLTPDRVASIRRELARRWTSLGSPSALKMWEFDGGTELRAVGRDKGDAVRTLARECGADAVIAYLGDDHTDEDAFAAVPVGGAAVLVNVALRPTAAQLWLCPPDELLMFLRRWNAARGRPS
jgi:trehalose-phosphatase